MIDWSGLTCEKSKHFTIQFVYNFIYIKMFDWIFDDLSLKTHTHNMMKVRAKIHTMKNKIKSKIKY